MNDTVIFCTSYTKSDPQRYQDWINYYTEFFAEDGIDLHMINDGPSDAVLDLKGITFHSFAERMGRITTWKFPGWKRSFYHALKWFTPRYKRIGHVESDCWITKRGKIEFLKNLHQDGYFTGYTNAYSFPEAALQILNRSDVIQYLMDKYSCIENWHEDIDFERDLMRLKPTYMLSGERIETIFSRFDSNFTYLSQTSYSDFLKLYGNGTNC